MFKTLKQKLQWIRSYANHPGFISSYQERIRKCLEENGCKEEETILVFSAHGVPAQLVWRAIHMNQNAKSRFMQ